MLRKPAGSGASQVLPRRPLITTCMAPREVVARRTLVGPAADWVRQPGPGGWTKGHRRRPCLEFPPSCLEELWSSLGRHGETRGLPVNTPRCSQLFPVSAGNTGTVPEGDGSRAPNPQNCRVRPHPPSRTGPGKHALARANCWPPAELRGVLHRATFTGCSPQLVLLGHGCERWQRLRRRPSAGVANVCAGGGGKDPETWQFRPDRPLPARVPLDGSVVFAWNDGQSSRRLHLAGDPLVVLPELEHTDAF